MRGVEQETVTPDLKLLHGRRRRRQHSGRLKQDQQDVARQSGAVLRLRVSRRGSCQSIRTQST